MRAAIYARYSSELQRAASIEDQLEVCRRLIAAQGWTEVKVYADRAVSGASRFRDGFQQILLDAEARRFDVLVTEALDRLGRKLSDVADLFDRLTYLGICVHTVAQGELTQLHVGVLGTMAQMYLSDLREKTWRGQLGRVRQGRIAGGLAYGYRLDPSEPGKRVIDPEQARVVVRIFRDYAQGSSPRAIARALNDEKVPGPNGRPWGDTTIRGQVARGTGLLNNPLYVGRMEWNRTAYVKDPRTGKRQARVNDAAKREQHAVPELRIIDEDLWQAVKRRQNEATIAMARDKAGNALNRLHRRKFLLSGLLVCGDCGGPLSIVGADLYGCSTRRAKGTCRNTKTVARRKIEARVLDGLKERLLAPDLVAEFVAAYAEEARRIAHEQTGRRACLVNELGKIERQIAALVRAIEDGMYHASTKERLLALEAEHEGIIGELRRLAEPAAPVTLHPNLAEVYRRKVAELETALNHPATRGEAASILRGLIECVVLHPGPRRGEVRAELFGELAALLQLEAQHKKTRTSGDVRVSLVAGIGFEPMTFRL